MHHVPARDALCALALCSALALPSPAHQAAGTTPAPGATRPESAGAAAPGGSGATADDFDARFRAHPYFKKHPCTRDATFAPFEILVEQEVVPEPGHDRAVVQFYGPWLARMAEVFEETIARRAQLPPGADPRPIRLIVLGTRGDYADFASTLPDYEGYDRAACYDARIRSVVTFWESSVPAHYRRYFALQRFVEALLHQRSTAPGTRQAPAWVREGVGRLLAWHTGFEVATAFARPTIDPNGLDDFLEVYRDPALQHHLLPLRELAALPTLAAARKRAIDAAAARGTEPEAGNPWFLPFVWQSALWVEYLRREGAPEHNAAFDAYLRAALAGGGGPEDLRKALGGADLATLDADCFRWIHARARALGKQPPDDARIATLFAGSAPAAAGGTFADLVARLALPADLRVERALALRAAAEGGIEDALARLEAAVARGGDDGDLAAARGEVVRLRAWQAARDAWLAELVASGGRLTTERDGKPLARRLTAVANGEATLQWAQGEERVRIATLAPAALAAQMKSNPAGAPEWVRAYAYAVCGDARWEKALKDKGPEAQALREDARATFVELRALGTVATHCAALSSSIAPEDAASARLVLDRLWRVARECGAHPLVAERRETLRAIAELAAGALHDAEPPRPALRGKATWHGEDELELEYGFDSAEELADWVQTTTTPCKAEFPFEALTTPEDRRSFGFLSGGWGGRGEAVLTHLLPFDAPFTVRVAVHHGEADREDYHAGHFLVATCVQGAKSYIVFSEAGEQILYHAASNTYRKEMGTPAPGHMDGQPTTLEIAHDGARVRFAVDATAQPELSKPKPQAGEIALFVHSDRDILVESVRIRGKLGTAARKRLRERWVAAKVAEAGW